MLKNLQEKKKQLFLHPLKDEYSFQLFAKTKSDREKFMTNVLLTGLSYQKKYRFFVPVSIFV
jgi:hypothetical protein